MAEFAVQFRKSPAQKRVKGFDEAAMQGAWQERVSFMSSPVTKAETGKRKSISIFQEKILCLWRTISAFACLSIFAKRKFYD
ncbi:hypothetical protein [Noviherbaspirillum humi]|uniref:hypothetical protein n=1 Tax=Noviherbaspirillum humi TaxID=1688639 RepID=UPI000B774CFC|nr:hypothetical protein [Noviherbaspirillum humi]